MSPVVKTLRSQHDMDHYIKYKRGRLECPWKDKIETDRETVSLAGLKNVVAFRQQFRGFICKRVNWEVVSTPFLNKRHGELFCANIRGKGERGEVRGKVWKNLVSRM